MLFLNFGSTSLQNIHQLRANVAEVRYSHIQLWRSLQIHVICGSQDFCEEEGAPYKIS